MNHTTKFGNLCIETKVTYKIRWKAEQSDQAGLKDIVQQVYDQSVQFCDHDGVEHIYEVRKGKASSSQQTCLSGCLSKQKVEPWTLEVLLKDLANRDILPEGEYVIKA